MVRISKNLTAGILVAAVSAVDGNAIRGKMVLQASEPHNFENSFVDAEFRWKSKIRDPVKKILKKIMKRDDPGAQCTAKREQGKLPSAADGDSPVSTFGYPIYSQQHNATMVSPGATLSVFGGYLTPVKVQASDYYISGKSDEIQSFFECFGAAGVEAADIDMKTGKWVANTGNLCMQVENTDDWLKSMSDGAGSVIVAYTSKRILGALCGEGFANAKLLEVAGLISDKAGEVVEMIQTLVDYSGKAKDIYPAAKELAQDVEKVMKDKKTTGKEKMAKLKDLITGASYESKRVSWDNFKAIDLGKKMIVTLTVHPRPAHQIRATYCFGKATLTMDEIGEAFDALVHQSPVSTIVSAVQG